MQPFFQKTYYLSDFLDTSRGAYVGFGLQRCWQDFILCCGSRDPDILSLQDKVAHFPRGISFNY